MTAPIHHDRAHADEGAVTCFATMEDGTMAHGAVLADNEGGSKRRRVCLESVAPCIPNTVTDTFQ
jgi:hypothetical protein